MALVSRPQPNNFEDLVREASHLEEALTCSPNPPSSPLTSLHEDSNSPVREEETQTSPCNASRPPGNRPPPRCYECGASGHLGRDCLVRKTRFAAQNSTSPSSSAAFSNINSNSSYFFIIEIRLFIKDKFKESLALIDTGALDNYISTNLTNSPPNHYSNVVVANGKIVKVGKIENPIPVQFESKQIPLKFSCMDNLIFPVILGTEWWFKTNPRIDLENVRVDIMIENSLVSLELVRAPSPQELLTIAKSPLESILSSFERVFKPLKSLPPHTKFDFNL